jgi:hypothetical protein
MVSLSQLVLPIVLSAVIVFIASSVLHMVLRYHNSDYKRFTNEDDVRAAINKGVVTPGQYMLPYNTNMKDLQNPAVLQKFTEGPVGLVFLRQPGMLKMGPFLGAWFVYTLGISFFAAYIAGRTLAPGAAYPAVFRVAASVAFLGYAGAHIQGAIWRGQPWSMTMKDVIDGLIYGLLTGGTFGWLWPR